MGSLRVRILIKHSAYIICLNLSLTLEVEEKQLTENLKRKAEIELTSPALKDKKVKTDDPLQLSNLKVSSNNFFAYRYSLKDSGIGGNN